MSLITLALSGSPVPIPLLSTLAALSPAPRLSLGGYPASTLYLPDYYNPAFSQQPFLGSAFRLFPDIQPAEATAGKTDYFALYLVNAADVVPGLSASVYLVQPAVTAISVWAPAMGTDGHITPVASETVAPAGASFTQPTSGSPLATGTFQTVNGRQILALWFKRVVGASAVPTAYDACNLVVVPSDGSTPFTFTFVWTIKAGLASVTITSTQDPMGMNGDTLTIATVGSNGSPLDPPSQTVYVVDVSGMTPPFQAGLLGFGRTSNTVLAKAIRTGTGAFYFDFKPTQPGFHLLQFDAGGELQTQYEAQVSPLTS